MRNLLFIGSFIPDSRMDEFKSHSRYIDIPGIVLQESLIMGFKTICNLDILTIPNLKTKKIYCKESVSDIDEHTTLICMGSVTNPILKETFNSRKILRKIESLKRIPDYIFLYSISRASLVAVGKYKASHPNVKVVMMVTDLLQYMSASKNPIYRFLKGIQSILCKSEFKHLDGVVLLSAHMTEKLPMQNLKYCVIEGVYSCPSEDIETMKYEKKVLLYTGAICERYGLKDLIEAFRLIESEDMELWLCGNTDMEYDLLKYCALDNRIRYFGLLPHDEVLMMQKKATLLVNPRHSDESFTRYSFPSKTMEYMGSGTPTLMSHLGCIPQEYNDHLYFFDDESIIGMSKKMKELCDLSSKELNQKGKLAAIFIKEKKNNAAQCMKILNFFQHLN